MKNFINKISILFLDLTRGILCASIIIVLAYLGILIVAGIQCKQGKITKQYYYKMTGLDEIIEFKKNYKIRLYMFIIDTIYKNQNIF